MMTQEFPGATPIHISLHVEIDTRVSFRGYRLDEPSPYVTLDLGNYPTETSIFLSRVEDIDLLTAVLADARKTLAAATGQAGAEGDQPALINSASVKAVAS